ncbi:MAG TPA: M28 family peptidase [Gemmatimonadaceae bacterium]|nr:M28 family peptidase [Gemmatimonadaceae bacterium]
MQWSALLVACLMLACDKEAPAPPTTGFSGESALRHATTLMSFGPRVPGTEGWRRSGAWIAERMRESADTVFAQEWMHTLATRAQIPQRNIIARFRPELTERILYVAHWDTRPRSDLAGTSSDRALPVPGANDNAAGVGLLIALAEMLDSVPPAVGVDLLFVDGEDWGSFDSMTDVLIGSSYFARNIPWPDYRPLFGVVWDMIGDADLQIYQEINSVRQAPEVVQRVWSAAADLGLSSVFIPEQKTPITDDHLPLLRAGLRVIDVIDIDYPYHHRPTDTIDKISAASLQKVGDVAAALVLPR